MYLMQAMNNQTKKILFISLVVVSLLLITPTVSNAAAFIKRWEVGAGGNPYLVAVPDTNGYWQIGFGSTWNYAQNRWVKQGDTITPQQAIEFLNKEIAEKTRSIESNVKVPINSNQKTALVSLAYNIGTGAFAGSTLLKLLNAGKSKAEVAEQFLRWDKVGKSTLQGLANRRQAEKQLFLS